MNNEEIRPGRMASAAMKAFLLFMCRMAFRPQVTYISEKAREEAMKEPQVIIANHIVGMDGAVIYAALRKPNIAVISAADTMVTYPILQWLFRFLPVLKVDRKNVSLSWLRESRKRLHDGEHIMIFPEGKVNKQGVMQPFKPGAVLLASMAGVRVTPVYHNGVYDYFLGRRFRMIVGEPMTIMPPPEGVSSAVLKEEADRLYDTVHDLEKALNGYIRADENSIMRRGRG